ncbi:hypothetical protein SAMN04487958_110101 [Vreelandella subterranea]|uniref:DUF927 domain-containing protein n=1 Tax=Vreelandella subterranea TaxID=416874 RepID=A0A1H9VRS9_9GAMM|nr:hypothetical protein [Halomonas subterranea]SES24087.1 hypothetical protein SAMN04487958_110101 [Halomonas subterranea]
MNELDFGFDFDRYTGECGPPTEYTLDGLPATGSVTSFRTSNEIPSFKRAISARKLQQPQPNAKLEISGYSKQEGVLQQLYTHYELISEPTGQLLLIDKSNGAVLPADPAYLVGIIQRLAHDHGVTISGGMIKTAVRIMRARGTDRQLDISMGPVGYAPNGQYQVIGHLGYWGYWPKRREASWLETPAIPTLWPTKSLFSPFSSRQVNAPHTLNMLLNSLPLDQDDHLLLVTWMVLAMMPYKRQVLLELIGAPENGKSTLLLIMKELINPSTESLIQETPRNLQRVRQLAKEHYLISLDNVSSLSLPAQHALSHVMAGMSVDWGQSKEFSTPLLTRRPVALNAEKSVITEPTLKRQTLTLQLDAKHPLTSDWINRPSNQNHLFPNSFAALLQLLGEVHAMEGLVILSGPISSGWEDFYRIGVIVARFLGRDDQAFSRAFQSLQAIEWQDAVDESPVATALMRYIKAHGEDSYTHSVKDWLEVLDSHCPDSPPYRSRWPETPNALGAEFGRCKKLVAYFGLRLESLGKRGSRCLWQLSKMDDSEQSAPVSAHIRWTPLKCF